MRKGIITILIIGLCSGLWIAAQSWSKHLAVSKITVHGTMHIDSQEILRMVALSDTVLFEDIDLGEIQRRVEQHPYVRSVSVNRDFPATIRITVKERTPDALLVGSRMAILDEENIVMPVRHGNILENLPIISGEFSIPETGDTLRQPGVGQALQIIRATRDSDEIIHHLFSELRVLETGGLVAYTTDYGVPVYLGDSITAQQIVAFKEFWLQEVVSVGADQIQNIDLRFDDQVVTRWRTGR